MRLLFVVCLSLFLIAKIGSAGANTIDAQVALRLACSAAAEIYDGDKRQLVQRDCGSNYKVSDAGNDFWLVEPKQHSFGYTSFSVRKSNGDIITHATN
jgi:hypothetical protein